MISFRSAVANVAIMGALLSTPMLIAQSPIVAQSLTDLGKKANSQMAAKDFDGAIATYQTLLTEVFSPADKGDLWARIGEAYRFKGDYPASIQAMEKAVAFVPNNGAIVANLGLLYDAQGDFAHARLYYERSLAINPNNPLALNNLAYLLAETGGDLDLALRYARAANAKMPDSMAIVDTLGWVFLKRNMLDAAVFQFRLATKGEPDNAEYHYHYALGLYRQGNLPDALDQCKLALADRPKIGLGQNLRDLMSKLAPKLDTHPPSPPAK